MDFTALASSLGAVVFAVAAYRLERERQARELAKLQARIELLEKHQDATLAMLESDDTPEGE